MEPRGTQSGMPTWLAVPFGGLFVVVGGAIVLVGTRIIPVAASSVHVPWWVLTMVGVVFALGGLLVWSTVVRQYQAERRRQRAQRRDPDEPALADYGWDADGFAAPRWSRAMKALLGAAGLSLFLSIFNYWAFGMGGPWMVKIIVGLFDLILVAAWWGAFLRLGRAAKFGGSRIEFTRFPYRLGEPVMLRWFPGQGIVRARKGRFTLRCAEQWYERHGSGKNRSTRLVQEVSWSGTWYLDEPTTFTRGEVIVFRFEPPVAATPTQLSATQPVFWEFVVTLDLPGLDFEETYLVPVYADKP
jgi:hypothetical protein